jgi:hypothetical protein
MKTVLSLLLFCLTSISVFAQEEAYSRKGEAFVYWGYNRSTYTNSDIHFMGKGYDFTLYNVIAKDAPTPFNEVTSTYINPSLLSIPQFNFRGGYFINDHWAISLGWDHMKYVADDWQTVKMTGTISPIVSSPTIIVDPQYVGTSNNTNVVLNPDRFLHLEHTDGFNYAAVELDRYDRLWTAKKAKNLSLDWLVGAGVGAMIPRSDVHLFSVGANHYWNVSGYGASLKAGLRLDFSRRMFFQTDIKGGFSRLNAIPTTGQDGDYAQQSIWWGEFYGALGYKFGKIKKKK